MKMRRILTIVQIGCCFGFLINASLLFHGWATGEAIIFPALGMFGAAFPLIFRLFTEILVPELTGRDDGNQATYTIAFERTVIRGRKKRRVLTCKFCCSMQHRVGVTTWPCFCLP